MTATEKPTGSVVVDVFGESTGGGLVRACVNVQLTPSTNEAAVCAVTHIVAEIIHAYSVDAWI